MYRLYDGREKDFEIVTADLEIIKNYLGELYSDCKDIDELSEELEKNNDGMDFHHVEHFDVKFEAIEKLYNSIDCDINSIFSDIKKCFLSLNTARNGKYVLWYLDESKEAALYIDTLEFLTDEEIEKELM